MRGTVVRKLRRIIKVQKPIHYREFAQAIATMPFKERIIIAVKIVLGKI